MAPTTTRRKSPGSEELRKVKDREIELRRLAGDVSCADCRRLKLKCDKKIPCSSCVRRGAESFCPLGLAGSSGQSSRSILANHSNQRSQRWKRKVILLSERVRALEDALALESAARGGSGSHPLLTEELLAIKHSLSEGEDEDDGEEEGADQLVEGFGTLSMGESRTMRYLGPAASESALLMEVLENSGPRLSIADASSGSGHFSREIIHSSRSFPFAPLFLDQSEEDLLAQLVSHIPPFGRATALYEAFFRNLSWFVAPIERSHFVSEIIPLFYPNRKPVLPGSIHSEHAHDLALLFVLFACGAAGDLTQDPVNDEAAQYYTLARAALGVRSIMHGASLSGVQTLYLLAGYDIYTGQKNNQEDAWKLFTLGSSMAAAIGLHRDPSRWGLDAKTTERRRRIFWEIYVIDKWRGLESGRPTIFRPSVVDCEFPSDTYATIGEDGEITESITQWRYRYSRDVASEICEKITSARPLRYRDVLELDRKIRDFPSHPSVANCRPEADLGVDAEFRKVYPLITVWDKEESLMYIHRNFFARAALDFPDNPMRSPFAASFLATYRSASAVIRICRENLHTVYHLFLRIWQVWSLCLTCGVIAGAVASLGSSVSFATSAFVELEYTIALFEKFGDHKVARHGLPLLRRIREKAIMALRQPRQRHQATDDSGAQRTKIPTIRNETDYADDELLILRGTTRIIEQRGGSSSSNHSGSLSPEQSAAPSPESYAGTSREPGSSDTSPSPRLPMVPPNQQHNAFMEDTHDTRSQRKEAQDNLSLHVPQASSDAWLAELEGMLGSSPSLHHPNLPVFSTEQQTGGTSFDWLTAGYAQQSTAAPNYSHESTSAPSMPSYGGAPSATCSAPEVLLDQTVSTEDWRQFLQHSGFSSTPPFDFGLDPVVPPANSTVPDWYPNP